MGLIGTIVENPVSRLLAGVVIVALLIPVVFTILPNWEYPDEMNNGVIYLTDILWSWDFIFPVSAMLWCLGIYIVMELIFISIKIALFIWRMVMVSK